MLHVLQGAITVKLNLSPKASLTPTAPSNVTECQDMLLRSSVVMALYSVDNVTRIDTEFVSACAPFGQ